MKCAFVFPGQGSQTIGMGKDFYDNTEIGKKLFDSADEILGYSLSQMCFEGPAEELNLTINTQPALYTVSVMAGMAAKEKGFQPCVCAGHSAGEYAALCLGGAFSFEDGLKLIAKRAAFMNECAKNNPGKMAAVLNLDYDKIKEILSGIKGICVAANINSLVQTVISGEAAACEEAMEKCKEAGAKRVVPLNVSGAFHSPLMKEAAEKLKGELDSIEFRKTEIPVIANYTADFEWEPEIIKDNLIKQITGSVRWVETCEKMKDMGVETAFECGAGTVLCGLIRKTTPEITGKKISAVADFE